MSKLNPTALKGVTLLLSVTFVSLGFATGFGLIGCGLTLATLCGYAWLASSRRQLLPLPDSQPEEEPSPEPQDMVLPADGESGELVRELMRSHRYALLLRPQIAPNLDEAEMEIAQEALDDSMSIVPAGEVVLTESSYEDKRETTPAVSSQSVDVEAVHLDRTCVTNAQYMRFVEDGGYEQVAMWEPSIWPAVLEFVDLTGYPGPRFWKNGTFQKGLDDHPVVGISWFEACAYARWVGKRLPTSAEWVKAGCWPVSAEGETPSQRKYPWGDSMDRNLANLWGVGRDETCAVGEFKDGSSVGGVLQLIGNVWEWTHTSFMAADPQMEIEVPMKVLHGGAFDTYFDGQANNQFRSADSPLSRKHNVGFRCALGICDVVSAYSGIEPDYEEAELAACAAEEEDL